MHSLSVVSNFSAHVEAVLAASMQHLSLSHRRSRSSAMPHVCVLGAGFVGLATAVRLQEEARVDVTLVVTRIPGHARGQKKSDFCLSDLATAS